MGSQRTREALTDKVVKDSSTQGWVAIETIVGSLNGSVFIDSMLQCRAWKIERNPKVLQNLLRQSFHKPPSKARSYGMK